MITLRLIKDTLNSELSQNHLLFEALNNLKSSPSNTLRLPGCSVGSYLDLALAGYAEIIDPVHNIFESSEKYDEPHETNVSSRAISFASNIETNNIEVLSQLLYSYNRRPMTPRLRSLLPNRDAVEEYLNFREIIKRLRGQNLDCISRVSNDYWHSFGPLFNGSETEEYRFKLYLCPTMENTRECFSALVDLAIRGGVRYFKCFSTVYGMCRSDKIVAYFTDQLSLIHAAKDLLTYVDGVPSQPTPFTHSLSDRGLISWGVDPRNTSHWSEYSWRSLITFLIASGLVSIKESNRKVGISKVGIIKEKLNLMGIDSSLWTPPTWLQK